MRDPQFTVAGVPAGATLSLLRNGVVVSTVFSPGGGTVAIGDPGPLLDGQYTYTASLVDDAGNQSPPSGPLTVSIVTVQGDYTDSGFTNLAVFDRVNPGVLDTFIAGGITPPGGSNAFGSGSLDIPFQGDLDGDGKTDLILYRPSTSQWFVQESSGGFQQYNFGAPGDIPVVGDFDGVGHDELGVYQPSTGQWFVAGHAGVFATFGGPSDIPVPLQELLRHRPGRAGGVPAEHGPVVRGGSVQRDQLRRGRGRPDPVVQLLRQRTAPCWRCTGRARASGSWQVRPAGSASAESATSRSPAISTGSAATRSVSTSRARASGSSPGMRPPSRPSAARPTFRWKRLLVPGGGSQYGGHSRGFALRVRLRRQCGGAVGGVELIIHAGGGDFIVGLGRNRLDVQHQTTPVVSPPTQGKRPKQAVKHSKNHLHDLAIASLQDS